MSEQKECLGIDLGTTYSSVGIYRNGKIDIIPNECGYRIISSVVSFKENQIFVGNAAKIRNYQNTVYDVKRIIGRTYNEEEVQKEIKLWPFKVIKRDNNKPKIEVEYKGQKKVFILKKYHLIF